MFVRALALSSVLVFGCSAGSQGPEPESPLISPPIASAPAVPPGPKPPGGEARGAGVETLFVDAKLVPCEGEGMTTCLRVRDDPSHDWTLFYRTIEGFTFEPGHSYELKVEVTPNADRPSDASSRRYRLVEIVSKRRAP